MKKLMISGFLFLLCLSLTACRSTDYINLASFIENYNRVCGEEKIGFDMFYTETKSEKEITNFFPSAKDTVAVRLIGNAKNQIEQVRVVLRKCDSSGNALSLQDDDLQSFLSAAEFSAYAFSNGAVECLPEPIAPKSVSQLSTDVEKTASDGSFTFVYYSNSVECVITMKNKWLSPTETTKKPENKEPFAQMTETRNFTVPHR